MRAFLRLSILASLICYATTLAAQQRGKSATIIGDVVDTACYLGHNMKGPDHAKCATMCAKNGIPLAVLEAQTGLLYLPVALDHKNPNEKLLPFVEKRVRVTGAVIEKGGLRGIVIREISEAR